MKLTIKMGVEETEAFKNFMSELRPPHVTEEEFTRTIFYKGVERFQEELMEKMKAFMEENADQIDASAIEALGSDVSAITQNPSMSGPTEKIQIIED